MCLNHGSYSRTEPHGHFGLQTEALAALPYDSGALEPHISTEIMWLHHTTYVNTLNITEEE